MSIVAELLKSNAVKASQLVLNQQATLKLGIGDLLKLPEGEGVQTLRQGQDLVVLIDAGDGSPPERVVVQGFFAAGSLGMVQIGPDGNAEMLTPRSVVATLNASPSTPAAAAQPEASEATESSASAIPNQLLQELAVSDASGVAVTDQASPTPVAVAGLAQLLDSVADSAPLEALPDDVDRSLQSITAANLYVAPALAPLANGVWINAQNLRTGADFQGEGADGCVVELSFVSARTTITHSVTVQDGQWAFTLSGAEISQLGEGALSLSARQLSGLGQVASATVVVPLTIDTIPPLVPVVNSPLALRDGLLNADDATSSPLTFTVRGEPGSVVTLTLADAPAHTASVSATVNAQGQCQLDIRPLLTGLSDGPVLYTVQSVDAAGNVSTAQDQPGFALHQTLPDAPLAALKATDDHGAANNDGVTNVTAPGFTGRVASNVVAVRVYRDLVEVNGDVDHIASANELITTLTPNADGSFSYQAADLGTDAGAQHFLFVGVDAYGNRSATTTVNLLIDNTVNAPTMDPVTADNALSYAETLASSIPITGSGEPFAQISVTLSANGLTHTYEGIQVDADGKWTANIFSNVVGAGSDKSLRYGFGDNFNGYIDFVVKQTDLAGNGPLAADASRIYVRTTPIPQIDSLAFAVNSEGKSDDTGASSTDGVTKLSSFRVQGVGPASDPGVGNMEVWIYNDKNGNGAVDVGTDELLVKLSTDAGGTFSGSVPSLPDGEYRLISVVHDLLSGSESATSGINTSLSVVVDTAVGNVAFDDIVSSRNIVTLRDLESGFVTVSGEGEPQARVSLVFNAGTVELSSYTGIQVNANGKWSVQVAAADITAFGSTSVTMRATQTDLAGNASLLSNSAEKVFDVKLGVLETPTAITLLAADDTGLSNSDGITNKNLGLTISGESQPGYVITLFRDANRDGVLQAGEIIGTATVDQDGHFAALVNLPEGSNQIRALATDDFGQTSGVTAAYTVVVDKTIAAPISLLVTQDNIINAEEASSNAATFSGVAKSQATVSLDFYSGANRVFPNPKTVQANLDGTWQINLTQAEVEQLQNAANGASVAANAFAGGNAGWIVKAQQTDLAGNVSTYAQQSFVIDTVAPLVDDTNNVDAALAFNEDPARPWRSALGDDQLTWSELYGFSAGMAQPKTLQVAVALLADVELNDTVRMTWGTKTVSHQVRTEDLARGYALVDIGGDVIERNRTETASNAAHVTATFVDVAGNESNSVEVMTSVNVTLAGAPPLMAPTLDSYGVYNAADATYYSRNSSQSDEAARQTFTLVGQAAVGDQVLVFNDMDAGLDGIVQAGEELGTFMADSLGNFTAILSLLPGHYHLRAVSIVTEGASPTNVQSVVIDITAPDAPTLTNSVIAGNNRVGAAERDAGVTLTGTGEAFARLNVQLKNVSTGVVGDINQSVTVGADGTWSITIGVVQWGQVGDGTVQVLVSQSDRSGNTSPVYSVAGSPPQVQFDTVVATPVIFTVADDNIINATEAAGQVVFRGGGEPGATMTLTFNGSNGSVGPNNVVVDANGLWTYSLLSSQLTTRLGNGQVAVDAVQTDLAGNVSVKATRVVLIDTLVFAPQIAAVSGDDVVNAGERALGVPISGSAEPGATLTVSITGDSGETRTINDVVVDQGGEWHVTFSPADIGAMGDGNCTVTVNQVDLAGNSTLTSTPPRPGLRVFNIATAPLTEGVVVNAVTGDNQVLVAEQLQGIVLQGTAPRNTTLHLSLAGVRSTLNYTVTIGADSNAWSIPLDTAALQNTLGAGTVRISAYADNNQQQSTPLLTQNFTIEVQEPSASISRVATDNYINALEAAASITLDGGGVAGHLVEVTISSNLKTLPFNVVVGDDRKWNVTLSVGDMAQLGNGTITVSTVQKASSDANAQRSIPVSSTFVIDTLAPGVANDSDTTSANAYNSTQSAMAGGVTVVEARNGVVVSVALPADAVAGDRFTVNWGNVQVTQVITAAMVPAQGARVAQVTIPTGTLIAQGDGVFDVSVFFTDIAGNSTAPRVLASSLPVLAPPAPPSFNAVYADNYINATEFQAITAGGRGQISGNAADGGVVNLTLTGPGGVQAVFNALPVAGGSWTAQFTPEQLLDLGEGRISASAIYVSATGAASAASVADIVFDKTAPLAPATTSANFLAAVDANARNELAGGLIRNDNAVTEAATSATVNVPLATDVVSGDVVTLFWGAKQQVNAIVTQADISRGYAQMVVSSFIMSMEGDNDALQVKASVTDKAGNVGAQYMVWTGKVDAIPVTPEVDNIESNNYVNIAKAAAGWHVTGRGVAHATVVVTITGTNLGTDGRPVSIVTNELAVTENAEGVYTWGVSLTDAQAQFLGDGRIKITSVQYDENRNPSDPGKNPSDPSIRYFYIDRAKPDAPGIDNVTADNRVSFAEGQSDVTISGTGETDATLSLTISHAGTSYIKTATVVDNVWSVVLASSELQLLGGGSEAIVLNAVQTDAAGNASVVGSKSFLYTTNAITPPTFTSVTGIAPLTDTAFNLADRTAITAQTPFTVSGRAQYDAVNPNTVRLSAVTEGGARFSWILDVDAGGNWTKVFSTSELNALNQGKVYLTAVQIAKTGDESVPTPFATQTVDNSFLIDTVAPVLVNTAVTVVDPVGLTKANAKAGDVITVTVQASERLQVGNLDPLNKPSIQLDLGNGQTRNAVYDAALSQTAGADKLVFTYTVLNGDNGVAITPAASLQLHGATLSDVAFNPAANSIASHPLATIRVDTAPPAKPTILPVDAVEPTSPGAMLEGGVLVNKINVGEASAGVKVRIDLNVGVGSERPLVGDSVELVWTVVGNTPVKLSKQITSLDLDVSRGYIDVTVPANVVANLEGSATLQATLVDSAGNRSPVSDDVIVRVDTLAPEALDFDLWMQDNKVNLNESLNNGAAITAITGTGLEAGATVTTELRQGSVVPSILTVAAGTDPGTWAISKAQMQAAVAALSDGNFSVTMYQTDAAGNRGLSRTVTYYKDTSVPGKPTITAVPQNEDGWINLRDAQTVGVTVAVSLVDTLAVAGDTLVIGGFTSNHSYTLTPADISANQVSVTMTAAEVLQSSQDDPAAVGRVLNAFITDQGGNVSPVSANFSVNIDTNIKAPTVDLTQGAAKGVSKNQAKAPVDFFGGGVEIGAQVSVYFTGVLGTTLLSTSTGDATHNFKVTLQPNDLASLGDGPVSYRVVQTDKALNTSVETQGSFDLRLSTPMPTLLNMTEDNVISASKAANAFTDYKGLGIPGDLITVNFYVRDAVTGLYQTTPAIAPKTATVLANGEWTVRMSKADFIGLSPLEQGTVQVLATQTEDGSTSGNADLEFYIDRKEPTLAVSTNLLTYTQAFDYSAWNKSGGAVKANQIANPLDGAVDAEAIIVNKATNAAVNEYVNQTFAVTAGKTYTISMYVKNGTANLPVLEMTTSGEAVRRAWFDLSQGSAAPIAPGSNFVSSIASVGNGWYRASLTFTATATTTDTFWFSTRSTTGDSGGGKLTSDGISPAMYAYGAQIEVAPSATTYKPVSALPSLTLFDGNGDGANNDGLLVTFSEPVAEIKLLDSLIYVPSANSLGKDFKVQAVDSRSINGQFYATQFKLFLDTDNTMVAGNTIKIPKSSIVDAGGNTAGTDQYLTIPSLTVPGLPTPPVDIMSDNRINRDEASNVTRLTYSDTNTAAQMNAALGGLMQTYVNGVLADEVIPKVNFLSMTLTLSKAAKLLQGQASSAVVRVTFRDGSKQDITLYTTGTPDTQATATNKYTYTSKQTLDLANISDLTYLSANLDYGFRVPMTVDPTGVNPASGLKVTSTTTNNVVSTTATVTLDFPNTMTLASGVISKAQLYLYFTDLNRWETVDAIAQGTSSTANVGFTRMTYTYTSSRPVNTGNNFFPDSVPTAISLAPITVVTTGANAPVILAQYDTSVVVPTSSYTPNVTLTTTLLDKNLAALAGTLDTFTSGSTVVPGQKFVASNPNRILYTQSLTDAVNAAGRKLQMFVDGVPVGTGTTMGIDVVNLYLHAQWENQSGNLAGWGAGQSLQAGSKVTARLTVSFKTIAGYTAPSVEVLVTAVGNQSPTGQYPLQFVGDFVDAATGLKIDATSVANIVYKTGSISQIFPNEVPWQPWGISTSQYVDLPAAAWAGQTDGLKQLTAQITTTDGTRTSVYSAPKQIRLDQAVGSITSVALESEGTNAGNAVGTLDAGDTLQVRFSEPVSFTFSALPASFGTNAQVTPIGSENGFSQVWNVKLGTGATVTAGQTLTLEARKVFDQAGNDNGTGPATAIVIPTNVMTRAGTPIIDNVSFDNVVENGAAVTAVTVNLTKVQGGDKVTLFMDGVQVGLPMDATGRTSVTFNLGGDGNASWGGDGERRLTATITRGADVISSAPRSVYVATEVAHWSQEKTYAGRINWFNPDAIVQADGTKVFTWVASAGGMTLANGANNSTIKITDAITGHVQLAMDGSSVFYEVPVAGGGYLAGAPQMQKAPGADKKEPGITYGFTDFTMFKPTVSGSQTLMAHPIKVYTSNTSTVYYTPTGTSTQVAVQPNTPYVRNVSTSYSFSTDSNVTISEWPRWNSGMTNVISVGSWQMVSESIVNNTAYMYNQMRFNAAFAYGNWTPTANDPLTSYDVKGGNGTLFRIGGGIGLVGDQIDITASTDLAYQQEIGTYLAAKFQSTGSVWTRNADPLNTSYDLTKSNVPGTLIDQNLTLNDAVSNDTVQTAGADYVVTGAGNDVVAINDLTYRYLDGGSGYDTLKLDHYFIGNSKFTLSDYASNYRGTSTLTTAADNARVNDAGYHRLLGFEKIDTVQSGDATNLRQQITVSAADVVTMSDTQRLEFALGKEDVIKTTGFTTAYGKAGIWYVNGNWYDHYYEGTVINNLTGAAVAQKAEMYTSGGDRVPEAVSFKTVSALNQVQITFDHAMQNSVLAGDFQITTYSGPSLYATSALSVNLRQGVSLTLSGPLNYVSKITYNNAVITDEAGRSFLHNVWMLGTNGADTLNGASLSSTEQAKGVTFMSGNGNDTIVGTSGADLIIGGLGADVLTGGRGSDTFYYRNEITGSGSAGGLGGTSGDVITDFTWNDSDPSQNDRIDLSALFENFTPGLNGAQPTAPTGNAAIDAVNLINGGFLEVRKVTNFQTGKQDLQLWVDRDGGGLYGQLATIANGGTNLPQTLINGVPEYPAVEPAQDFLTRLLAEGRIVVSHF